MKLLHLWQARRTTMLLVTHDIDEAIDMSDRNRILDLSQAHTSSYAYRTECKAA